MERTSAEVVSVRSSGLAMLSLLPLIHSPLHADWTHFRHDAAHTGCADESVSPPLELRWRFLDVREPDPLDVVPPEMEQYLYPAEAPGRGGHVSGGTVCGELPQLLASGGNVLLGRNASGLTCLDGATGDVRWHHEERAWFLAVERGRLLLWDAASMEVAALDPSTGQPIWALPLAALPRDARPAGGLVVNRGLICGAGRETHEYQALAPVANASEPALGDVREIEDAFLCWLSVVDGSPVDRHDCLPPGVALFAGVATPYMDLPIAAWGRSLILLAHPGGSRGAHHGRRPSGPWALTSSGEVTPTPPDAGAAQWGAHTRDRRAVLLDTVGIAVSFEATNRARFLTARDALTGGVLWRVPVRSAHNWNHPPAGDDTGVYLGLADGFAYGLDVRTGEVRWQTRVGDPLPSSMANDDAPICSVARGLVWVAYRGKLLALDAETGDTEWETDETEACWYEPVISGGWIYLLTCRGVEAWGPATARPEEADAEDEHGNREEDE